ncbi:MULTISPECIES: hypothetical protein [Massilia]|jgi:hypothetical protein|uniref:hypothetical protein n=1 Tax=Massilia TaxID=149698 RepID=UPI0004E2A779|nr:MULTISPECIES: hypothetical protein [Massilia]KFC72596.1 hypothetical protein FG94_01773 [Massilia sp. LC238]
MNNALQLAAPAGATLQTAAPAVEPPVEIFDRYADSIIGCYAHQYDAVEVHGVRNFASGTDNGTCYEIDNITPTSFSVYVHLKEGGLDCVGDFGKYDDAVQYGAEVSAGYGWPVRNYVLDQHRITRFPKLQ